MRTWQGKAEKMRSFAVRQRQLLVKTVQGGTAQASAGQQAASAAVDESEQVAAAAASESPPAGPLPPSAEQVQPNGQPAQAGGDGGGGNGTPDMVLGLPEVQGAGLPEGALFGADLPNADGGLVMQAVDAAPLDSEEAM